MRWFDSNIGHFMDAKLEKAVAEYREKTATSEDMAIVHDLKPGALARYERNPSTACVIMSGGEAHRIVEGDEILVPTTPVTKTFPIGTPKEVIEAYFEDQKKVAIKMAQDKIESISGSRDAEIGLPVRQRLTVEEKDGCLVASEEFGVFAIGA